MITELSLTNFKSWASIDQMRFAPMTGLFGTNSSGKTSIIQLLLMLQQTAESSDRSLTLDFGGEKSPVQLGSFSDLIFQHDVTAGMSFKLDWKLPKTLRLVDPENANEELFHGDSLSFDCHLIGRKKDGPPYVESLTYEFAGQRFEMSRKGESFSKYKLRSSDGYNLRRTQGRAWDLPAPTKCYGFPDQVFSYFQNAGFLADLQLAFEEFFKRLYHLGPLREYPQRIYPWSGAEPDDMGQRGERVIHAMLAAREWGKYIDPGKHKRKRTLDEQIALWLKTLGLIESFSVKQIATNSNLYEVRVRKSRTSPEVLITDVGFGVSQVLPVLVLCYYVPEGSVVVLEQPEIHLHPLVQSGLADVFIDAIKTRGIQILLESHSEHLLRRLQRRIAEKKLDRDCVALYFCDADQGQSRLSNLAIDIFGNITNWPKDFFGDEYGEMKAMTDAAMKRKKETAG